RLYGIAVRIVGIESDRPFALGYSLVILLFLGIDRAQERMGYRQGIIQGKSLLRHFKHSLQGLGVRTPAKDPLCPVGVTQMRVRLRILWVQFNGLLIQLPCLSSGLFRDAEMILLPAQEGIVG